MPSYPSPSRSPLLSPLLLPLLLLLLLLPPSLSQIRPFTSSPLIWHTFDVAPTPRPTNWTHVVGTQPHLGLALFNGISNYIDLLSTRDDYGRTFPSILPYTLSLEYWVTWSQLNRWSRIFECGQGVQADNINIANLDTLPHLAVGVDSGPNSTRTQANNAIRTTTFQHIVVTLAQQSLSNNITGTMAIYIDGELVVYRNDSYLLKPVTRTHCWIGKSEYNPPVGTDQYFSGYVDDFFMYDYPLSAEAVLAHFILPRPPVYELTFSADPRLITRQPTYTYAWSDRDLNDGSNITKYHNGHLVLTGDSFIDMAQVSGASGVGAAVIPTIGGSNTGANGTLPQGWSIEVLFKALTVERWAKIYDIGSGAGVDNILLGYEDNTNRLRFEYFVNTVALPTMIVLPNAQPNTWYHIVVVMGQGATVATNTITSYVNGIRTNGTTGVTLPRSITRTHAYIGKSHWPDEYFDCFLDAFRLYDWALSATEVSDLYRSTNEQLVVDISNRTTPIYHTEPLAAFTFHSERPGNLSTYGSAYQMVTFNESHYGIAQFNGRTDYIDLTRFPDDPSPPLTEGKTGKLMPLRVGGSMSFEVWVKWLSLNQFSRVFDLGASFNSNQNTIILSNINERPDLLFETYAGTNYGGVSVPGIIRVGEWMHIVATIQQVTPNDTTSATAGLFKIYVDGVLQRSARGYLPYTFVHPSSFLGRSNYLTDGLFHGLIDSFYFYDYALQYEQVAAHHLMPRPPAFELAFTYDPRPWLGGVASAYTYKWEEFDPRDQGLNATSYHNGYLVLEGDSWVNLTSTTGYSTVGTTLPSVLFDPVQGSGPIIQPVNTNNNGWTIEVLVKLETVENNTSIFDFGNGATSDNVKLGYSGLEAQLQFQIVRPLASESTMMSVLTNAKLGQWYHIVIVLRVNNIAQGRCSISSFVDGVQTMVSAQRWMPTLVPRSNAFLGRSNTPGVGFFDMKLDTFRIYDYAISTTRVQDLFALTTAELAAPLLPLYDTAPIAQYTFDGASEYTDGISAFVWRSTDPTDSAAQQAAHRGVAHFNGVDQFVNLMTFLDDAGTPFPTVFGNTSLTFETWVKYERFGWYSRILDFGNGAEGDNVMVANFENTPRIAVHVYAGDVGNSTIINLPQTYSPNTWQHIVVTIEDQSKTNPTAVTAGRNGWNAALYSVYIQGSLVATRRGYIPRAVARSQSYLAKSHWSWDDLFQGSIDSFYFYNYALSGEQVNVHIVVPRPPIFDLSFSADPRILLGGVTQRYTYGWQDYDPTDTYANGTRYHSGHLVLSSRTLDYVDLSTPVGPESLGVVLPRIGGRVTSISQTTPGWSFEVIVKIGTTAPRGRLIDWSNGGTQDNIIIGYGEVGNSLVMQVYNELVGSGTVASMTLINAVVLDRWYHIVVVMKPVGATGWAATWEAYVDGTLASLESNKLLPQNVARKMAWLGRSTSVNDNQPYFTAKVDAIRVYDYALTITQAGSLYALAHDPNFVAIQAPSSTAASAASGGVPVGPTITPTRRSSSTGPGGVCEYGGEWPDRCECRCYTGYEPNCIPCPGEEPSGPGSSPAISAGGVVAIVAVVLFVVGLLVVGFIWWKNKAGRVTYSLDGGFSDGGGDTDGWLNPVAAKKAKVGGGGLLGSDVQDSSSTYDWQAYRSQGSASREASMGHWANQ